MSVVPVILSYEETADSTIKKSYYLRIVWSWQLRYFLNYSSSFSVEGALGLSSGVRLIQGSLIKKERHEMSRKFLTVMVVGILMTGISGVANAMTLINTISFGSTGNESFLEVQNSYEYTLPGLTILPGNDDSLFLSLTYKGNSNGGNGETWSVYGVAGETRRLIGELGKSLMSNDWYVTTWPFSFDYFQWNAGSSLWQLTINLNDNDSPGMDKLKIGSSSLIVNTKDAAPISAPVPVPGALLLLGSGLLGLVGIGIRKKRVEHL